MNKVQKFFKKNSHIFFYSTLIFGTFGFTSAFLGFVFLFIGLKEITHILALYFAFSILLAILSMYLLNKFQD